MTTAWSAPVGAIAKSVRSSQALQLRRSGLSGWGCAGGSTASGRCSATTLTGRSSIRSRERCGERPLVVVEGSVIEPGYMGLGVGAAAFEAMARLKVRCRMFAGDFTLLWHNSTLLSQEEIRLIKKGWLAERAQ
jgi:hypothetical protein